LLADQAVASSHGRRPYEQRSMISLTEILLSTVLNASGASSPEAIAVDPATKRLYSVFQHGSRLSLKAITVQRNLGGTIQSISWRKSAGVLYAIATEAKSCWLLTLRVGNDAAYELSRIPFPLTAAGAELLTGSTSGPLVMLQRYRVHILQLNSRGVPKLPGVLLHLDEPSDVSYADISRDGALLVIAANWSVMDPERSDLRN
jgi:hypothetical protein